MLNGVTLSLKSQVRILGVFLDSALSLDAWVSAAARNTFEQLKLVCQLYQFLEMTDLPTVE